MGGAHTSSQPDFDTDNDQQRSEHNAASPPLSYQNQADYPPPHPGMPGQFGAYPPQYGYPGTPTPDQNRGLALAGLILGIISLIAWIIPIFGFPFAIVGIILSALGRRSFTRRRMATWGLVLSIIGLALTIGDVVYAAYLYSHYYH